MKAVVAQKSGSMDFWFYLLFIKNVFIFIIWPSHVAFGILVPRPGIDSTVPTLETQNPHQGSPWISNFRAKQLMRITIATHEVFHKAYFLCFLSLFLCQKNMTLKQGMFDWYFSPFLSTYSFFFSYKDYASPCQEVFVPLRQVDKLNM